MSDATTLSKNQVSPVEAKAEDFSVGGKVSHEEAGGSGQIPATVCSPAEATGTDFKVSRSTGDAGTAVSSPVMVDCVTGRHVSYLGEDELAKVR